MRLLFLCNCCANWTVAQKRKRDGRLLWLFRNNLILFIFQSFTQKIHMKSYTNTGKPLQTLSLSAHRICEWPSLKYADVFYEREWLTSNHSYPSILIHYQNCLHFKQTNKNNKKHSCFSLTEVTKRKLNKNKVRWRLGSPLLSMAL